MKKIYGILLAAAFAAMALSSCVKGPEAVPATADNTVFFTAGPVSTRTAFTDPEGTSYPTVWTGNDQSVAISLKLANPKEALVSPSADGKTAAFTASFSESPEAPYVFYLLSPYSAYLSTYSSTESIGITVPAVQTPGPKSVDEAAQILLAKSAAFDTWPGKVSFALKHWTSYGKLSLQNLKLDGAKISALDLTASVDWAGRWYYSFADGVSTVNSGSKTITVNTESTDDIWFACAPVDLSGETLTLVVKTDKGTFTKEIKMPADRKFESGQVARFAVDMKDVELVPSAVYELVTDMKDLTYDSKVIIAAAAPEYGYAIGTTQNNNNRASAGVTKVDGKISDPAENVEVFVVESGTESGTYSLKATGHAGYLIGVSGSNYLRTEDEKSEASNWKITCEEGTYSIIENAMSGRFIRFNPSSNNIFSTYAASSSVKNPVALYKLAGSGGGDVPADKKAPGMVLTCTELTLNVGDTGDVSVTEIARDYDGEITYVSGNSAVATVDAEGIVTAVAAGTCTVTVTAKETETFKSEVLTCAITVKSKDVLTIAQVLTKAVGHLDNNSGKGDIASGLVLAPTTVAAINGSNIILKDDTGVMMAYKSKSGLVVGEEVEMTGNLQNYYGIAEFVPTMITKTGNSHEVSHGDPVVFDEAAIKAYGEGARSVMYIKFTGNLPTSKSNAYVNVGEQKVRIYNTGALDDADLGKLADIFAYVYGYHSDGYLQVLVTSYDANASSPFLTVDLTAKTWAADATDPCTVTVSVEEGGSWTYTAEGMGWATLAQSGNTLVVTPKAANTSTTANEGSVVLKNNADATKTATVSFTQAGVVVGSSFVLDKEAISAAHTTSWTYTSGEKLITAADGSLWTCFNTYASTGQVTIQMNKGKGSYVLTPSAPSGKKITRLVATCSTKNDGTGTGVDRTFDIFDGADAVLSDIKGNDLTAGVDISGTHSQLKIAPNETNGGACYIVSIMVSFE